MHLKEVLREIDLCCPFAYQEAWDNSGLQIGDLGAKIERVLLAFDFTEDVLAEAIAKKADLVVTHHPFFFQGLKQIDLGTAKGRMIAGLIEHHIAVISCHTCLDKMEYGVSAALGDRLGLIDCGFFLPEASGIGFGMAGYLPKKSTLGAFIESVKSNLALDALRYVGDPSAMVKKVVVMGGSGAEFMTEALKQSADVFVSGDFKYHDAQTANELGLPIIDAGHFGTEAVVMEPFMKKLTESIGEMEFLLSEKMLDFWSYR